MRLPSASAPPLGNFPPPFAHEHRRDVKGQESSFWKVAVPVVRSREWSQAPVGAACWSGWNSPGAVLGCGIV